MIAGLILSVTATFGAHPADAMANFRFLEGTWTCSVTRSGESAAFASDRLTYDFPYGPIWMREQSEFHTNKDGAEDRSMQMWGYNSSKNTFVALMFKRDGLATKTVGAWTDGTLESRSDQDGTNVRLKKLSDSHMTWTMAYPNGSSAVEDCKK